MMGVAMATTQAPLLDMGPAPAPEEVYAVQADGRLWTVCATIEEAEATVEGIRLHNRWWRNHNGAENVRIVAKKRLTPSDPLFNEWCCTWVPGHAGWNCQPVLGYAEEVRLNNKRGEQIVYVYAPTALLAIERAKFLLMERGKTGDY